MGKIGAQQDDAAARGMDDEDKPDQRPDGSPEQVDASVLQRDTALVVDRAWRRDELVLGGEEGSELDLLAVELWTATFGLFGLWRWVERDGRSSEGGLRADGRL